MEIGDLVWILKDNEIWLCQVLNPNVINQAEAYNPLTRDDYTIREALEIEIKDHPLTAAFCALPQSNKRACGYGAKLYTFERQNAPVYSVCPHSKNNTYYVFSTSSDGQIKVWLYENKVSILANRDGLQLFSSLRGQAASRVQVSGQFGRPSSVAGTSMGANVQVPDRGQSSNANNSFQTFNDILPKDEVATLDQTSLVKSLDFHPLTETFLLVETNTVEVSAWEVGTGTKLASRSFHVWDPLACSMILQATLANNGTVSVNRVKWNLKGNVFGVAYSKHIAQIFFHDGSEQFKNHLEIDAHIGSVNDIAFSYPNNQPRLVTCGEDKTVKVWNTSNGARLYLFEGHSAPVRSVSPHSKNDTNYVLSSSSDGKIKAWLYENSSGARIDYETPGRTHNAFNYNADGTRLFSCGFGDRDESFIVEWDESEGAVKIEYAGLGKKRDEAVQFDTVKNRFLVGR